MKKTLLYKLLAVTITGSLLMTVPVLTAAEDSTEVTQEAAEENDKTEAEKIRLIGVETEEALKITLKNVTGKEIKSLEIKETEETEYIENGNLLTLTADENAATEAEENKDENEEDKIPVIAADEEILLSYDQDEINKILAEGTDEPEETETENAEITEENEEAATEEIKVTYTIRITFSDDKVAELHEVAFYDMEKAELCLDGEVAYLKYESISDKKEVTTLEKEKALIPVQQAESEYSYEEDYTYEEDYDYSYEEDEDYSYEEDEDYTYEEDTEPEEDYGEEDSWGEEESEEEWSDSSEDEWSEKPDDGGCLEGGIVF